MDGASLVPQAAGVLSAYESHLSQEYGEQRVQGINLSKVSWSPIGRQQADFLLVSVLNPDPNHFAGSGSE